MLNLSNRLLAMMLCIANSFYPLACRTRNVGSSEEGFALVNSIPDCSSGVFRIQCADGHWEYQNLAAIEDDRVCPILQIKVVQNSTLRALPLVGSENALKTKQNCQLFRGVRLKAFSVSAVQPDQSRRLVLLDPPNNCALQTGDVDANFLELKVDQYTLSASERFPADFCRIEGKFLLQHASVESHFGKASAWKQCSGRYKASKCADWEEIPYCEPRSVALE